MKFGGTSVGSAERIAQAAELAIASARKGHRVVVVTSAMSGVTNLLIDAATNAARRSTPTRSPGPRWSLQARSSGPQTSRNISLQAT